MTRSLSLGCAMVSVLALVGACSSTSTPGDTPAAVAGWAGASPSAGSASTTAGSAGTPTASGTSGGGASAGATVGGTNTTGGTSGGASAGSAGASAVGGAGGASAVGKPPEGPFACTQFFGAYLTMEWWNAGFEQKVDNAKWQLKWHHHGHVSEWRKPDCPFWANDGDPMDDAKGAPIQSKCAVNSEAPDRAVFLMIDWELLSEKEWVEGMTATIANLKAKAPSVKRVDIMNYVRCPNNMMCNPGAKYGPGADDAAGVQDCYVPDYEDTAFQKIVDADPTFVALGPKIEMAMCNPSHNGAHMTGEGNSKAAADIAAYYTMHP